MKLLDPRSFVHALRGIGCAISAEANLRIHLLAAASVFAAASWLRLSPADWAILVLTVGVVIAAELMNTAVENVVDLASPGYHELAKTAKDAASGAVLVAAIASVGVGICILGPPLWQRLAT